MKPMCRRLAPGDGEREKVERDRRRRSPLRRRLRSSRRGERLRDLPRLDADELCDESFAIVRWVVSVSQSELCATNNNLFVCDLLNS